MPEHLLKHLSERLNMRAAHTQCYRRCALAGVIDPEKAGREADQAMPQTASQPIDPPARQRHLFSLSGGKFSCRYTPRHQFHQPPPHQRSRQRMARQNINQNKGKGPPATATLPTIGTKHPLATDRLPVGLGRIVAQRTAVPVQTARAAVMRTRRLLEGKSCFFNSWTSRTK